MWAIIHESRHTAQKTYPDDGYEYLGDYTTKECLEEAQQQGKISIQELQEMVEVLNRKHPWLILTGDKYVRQFNTLDGDTCTFRMKEIFWMIANKLDLFPEDY